MKESIRIQSKMIKLVDYDNIKDLSVEIVKLDCKESIEGFKFSFINKKNKKTTCFIIHSYRKALLLYNYLQVLFKNDPKYVKILLIKKNEKISFNNFIYFSYFVNYLYYINTDKDMYIHFRESYSANSIIAYNENNQLLFTVKNIEEIRNFIKMNTFVRIPIQAHKEIYKKNTNMVKIYLLDLLKNVENLWLPISDDSLFPN